MGLFKDERVFHPDGGKAVDIEEPPVIDLLRGDPPVGKPPGLLVEKLIEEIETVRIFRAPVEDGDIPVNKCPDS